MARRVKPLTATQVLNAKPKDKAYKLFDGGGLFLQVTPAGGKHWKMKYRQANGKESLLSFGAYPAVTLERARKMRDEARSQKAAGFDPGEVRRQEKEERQSLTRHSFRAIANEWMELAAKKVKPQTMRSYRWVVEDYLIAELGDKHIKDVKPSDILGIMRKIEERNITATCKKACQLCSQIMQYSIALGLIEIDPVPSIRLLLKSHRVTHRATILDPHELGKLLFKIDHYGDDRGYFVVKYALQLMPYVFVRTQELITAKWKDIDFENCEWRYTVSKTDTPHIVPLAPQVIDILKKLHVGTGNGELLFPNMRNYQNHISEVTMIGALRRMGYTPQEMSIHGFRATARTLLEEVLKERYDLIEHQLAHTVRDPNGRAYNRTQHLDERRRMMTRWANYLDSLKAAAAGQQTERNKADPFSDGMNVNIAVGKLPAQTQVREKDTGWSEAQREQMRNQGYDGIDMVNAWYN
ncbi:integrase arm-type DNA-binding domain-containing protein [Desulfovibrio piger]|uniref:tyrosine-type recombinase/integrase n=1 Tax=Desulfovibrio piger TaxID=901 RepID=UPI0025A4813B|nr:integrase arm-type DNA-binding domain-containing protein [Desulfovibrio piger]MDM8329947.1 integrase arm-type DNA-binding domain-containing protein [Desulfovibrio piger]